MSKSVCYMVPLLVLILAAVIVWSPRPNYVPPELWGIWRTDQPRYADRYLDISEALVTIGQGGSQLQVFFVQRVHRHAAGARDRYTLSFRESFEKEAPLHEMTVYLTHSASGPRLQLYHQDGIRWHRESGPPEAAVTGAVAP